MKISILKLNLILLIILILKKERFIHSLHDNISIENGINLVLGIHKFSDKILLTFISNQLVMDHMSLRILLDDFTYIYYCLYTKKK